MVCVAFISVEFLHTRSRDEFLSVRAWRYFIFLMYAMAPQNPDRRGRTLDFDAGEHCHSQWLIPDPLEILQGSTH